MAQKDPAFLFYTQDFYVGTAFLTHAQVGKYIRLICAQHQHGRLSEERIMHICGDMDVAVLDKFQKDQDGNYYNLRLEAEIEKRKKFSESRRGNIKKRWEKNTSEVLVNNTSNTLEYTSGDTSVIHMENENIYIESSNNISSNLEKENTKRKRKEFVAPSKEEMMDYAAEKGFDRSIGAHAWEYYSVADWKDAKGDQVLNWKQKMIASWFKNAQKGGKIQITSENDINIPGYVKEFHNNPLMKREVINGVWNYKSTPIGFKS
jgi:uncharacterized protein YdaU (DUF1376 family)